LREKVREESLKKAQTSLSETYELTSIGSNILKGKNIVVSLCNPVGGKVEKAEVTMTVSVDVLRNILNLLRSEESN
jgi:hypothetical protein